MNVLLIGSGGREHALAMALAKSPLLTRLVAAPGNPGIAALAACRQLDIADHAAILALCRAESIDFAVIGPEGPLVAGLVDDLAAAGIPAFGPSRAAAQLEGSKGFTKDLCTAANIPTAAYRRFDELAAAKAYAERHGTPIVVKADGLAAGKGVVVAATLAEAMAALEHIFAAPHGAQAVVEAVLFGEEASFFALCDGTKALALASAQDHKRVGEGETGPNTGGMGAYSPARVMTDAVTQRAMAEIIAPALAEMSRRGTPFKGMLFAGLMIDDGKPHLIEFNARFGDPETQVILPRLQDDLLALLLACAQGELPDVQVRLSPQAALCVVIAAQGYPASPKKHGAIKGVDAAGLVPGVTVIQAGTALHGGALVGDGGRVLNVTGIGADVAEARARAYEGAARIDYPDGFFRRDIGWRALERG